jgi:hypothetical protein
MPFHSELDKNLVRRGVGQQRESREIPEHSQRLDEAAGSLAQHHSSVKVKRRVKGEKKE